MKCTTMVTKQADGQGGGEGLLTIHGDEQELSILLEVLRKGNEYWGDDGVRDVKSYLSALLIRIDKGG